MNYTDHFWLFESSGQVLAVNCHFSKEPVLFLADHDTYSANQLWRFMKIKSQGFEIVHSQTDCILLVKEGVAKLVSRGKQDPRTIFICLKPKGINSNQAEFALAADQECVLTFEENLKCTRVIKTKKSQWGIVSARNALCLLESFVVENDFSGQVLDVPKFSLKKDQGVVQWPYNEGLNQRWFIRRETQNTYSLRNVCSQLCLQLKVDSKKEGITITQDEFTGEPHQLWKKEEVGQRLYDFRLLADEKAVLGVRNRTLKQGAEVAICKTGRHFWRVTGVEAIEL